MKTHMNIALSVSICYQLGFSPLKMRFLICFFTKLSYYPFLQYFVELPARSKLDLKIKTAFEITQICPYTQFGVLENENIFCSLFLFLGPITCQDTLIPNQWRVTKKWNGISMITFVVF